MPIGDPIWKGSEATTLKKVRISINGTRHETVLTYTGALESLLEDAPSIGATVSGFSAAGDTVSSVEIEDIEGGAAEMTVVLDIEEGDNATFAAAAIGGTVYEMSYTELQRPIEQHPRCGTLNPDRPKYRDGEPSESGTQRTWDDWMSLEESDGEGGGDYVPVTGEGGAGWSLAEYKSLREAGQDSYVVFYPTVSATTQHRGKPTGVGTSVGKKQEPPSAAGAPSGFQYLCMGDEVTKSERVYRRRRIWVGADYWSSLTYE